MSWLLFFQFHFDSSVVIQSWIQFNISYFNRAYKKLHTVNIENTDLALGLLYIKDAPEMENKVIISARDRRKYLFYLHTSCMKDI